MKWAKFSSHTAGSSIYVSSGRGWGGGEEEEIDFGQFNISQNSTDSRKTLKAAH